MQTQKSAAAFYFLFLMICIDALRQACELNIRVLTMSMKRLYCSEKKHEHWRFYCWGLGSPNPLRFLPVNILNPIHGLGVADFSKIPLGGGQIGVPEDDF